MLTVKKFQQYDLQFWGFFAYYDVAFLCSDTIHIHLHTVCKTSLFSLL